MYIHEWSIPILQEWRQWQHCINVHSWVEYPHPARVETVTTLHKCTFNNTDIHCSQSPTTFMEMGKIDHGMQQDDHTVNCRFYRQEITCTVWQTRNTAYRITCIGLGYACIAAAWDSFPCIAHLGPRACLCNREIVSLYWGAFIGMCISDPACTC